MLNLGLNHAVVDTLGFFRALVFVDREGGLPEGEELLSRHLSFL